MSNDINVLYRFYSACGELLYVGITNDPWRRFSQHRSQKDWWSEVSTICQQSFLTVDQLKVAEKKAIQSENPRYNKQFSIQHSEPEIDSSESRKSSLIGKFFHTWRDLQDEDYDIVRNGRAVSWQGQVIDQVGAQQFLIQLYSWWDGGESDQRIADISDMTEWTFYSNSLEMRTSLGCSDHTGPKHSRCGRTVAFMAGVEELGLSAVCNSCAAHYGNARPIIRRNGVLELGNACHKQSKAR